MLGVSKKTALFISFLSVIVIGSFLLRIVNLTKIPVFADEAIYIRWAQVMKAEPTLRFLPLSDGKQPLFMWVVIPLLKVFSNPLVSGRMASVLSGTGTLIGIALLSFVIMRSKKAAIVSSFLYAISPFTFFFDRMSLVDSMLTMFGVWFFVFLLMSIKNLRLDFAMLAGFALGGALLTKSPGLFFLIMTPMSLLFAPWKKKQNIRTFFKVLGLWIVTSVIGYGMYQILRLGPNFHMIASRNLDYVLPFTHVFTGPKDPLIFNVDRALEWLVLIGPFELIILSVMGFLVAVKRLSLKALFLVFAFSFPYLVGAMYAKVFTARYILYTLPSLFVLAGFTSLLRKKYYLPILVLFIAHALFIDWQLLSDPVQAPLPQSERSGYFEEWSAGWGIAETAKYIREEAAANPNQKIVVGTEGYFGTLPDGLQIYLEKVPNVLVIGTGLDFKVIPDSLVASRKAGNKTYFVVNSSRLKPEFKTDGLRLIYEYQKPARPLYTHEYVTSGPRETYHFYELN